MNEPAVRSDHEDYVRASVSPERWNHVRGVMEMAVRLVNAYPELPENPLECAALFHDNARGLSTDEQRRLAERYRGELDSVEGRVEGLWHAPAGAQRMVDDFAMDPEAPAVRAVAFHSTGHPGLGPVLKGLLVADFAEPNRTFSEARSLRDQVGNRPLDALVKRVLRAKINTCLERSWPVHPWGVEAYNALCD